MAERDPWSGFRSAPLRPLKNILRKISIQRRMPPLSVKVGRTVICFSNRVEPRGKSVSVMLHAETLFLLPENKKDRRKRVERGEACVF